MKAGTQTAAMHAHRLSLSDAKHRSVRIAVNHQVSLGQTASAAAIARAANVTESFLYRHESSPCQRCIEYFGSGPVSFYREQIATIVTNENARSDHHARTSLASLRADLANTQAANGRLRKQISVLERRLGEALGAHHEHQVHETVGPSPSEPERLSELESQMRRLTRLCSERDEELAAVRRLNADLTRQQNQK